MIASPASIRLFESLGFENIEESEVSWEDSGVQYTDTFYTMIRPAKVTKKQKLKSRQLKDSFRRILHAK